MTEGSRLDQLHPGACQHKSFGARMGGKKQEKFSPARREASTPRPLGVGPPGEEAGSLQGLHSLVVDGSWLPGSLEVTLKLSKQTPIPQLFPGQCLIYHWVCSIAGREGLSLQELRTAVVISFVPGAAEPQHS